MRKKAIGLLSLAAPALIGALAASCDKTSNPLTSTADALCGPCGTLATGDVGISGDAKLDGFFEAVGKIGDATAAINGDFNANIDALSQVYGVANFDASAKIDDKVTALISTIKAEFSADLGGITLDYTPAECHASVNVAVEAQAHCEAKAGCTGDVTPPSASVSCQGSCTGSCDGTCTGGTPPTCDVDASATCTGACEGTCTLDAAATCTGTCHGTCSGTCSAQDGSGNCAGSCDGMCKGSCELSAAATCSGSCSGKCEVDASAKCSGGQAPTCHGSCQGSCTGSCTGTVTPPAAHANCDASADCNAQASAKANASLECTPPSINLAYNFSAGVDAAAQADFIAHIGELKVRGGAILQGFTKYGVLINGVTDANGTVVVQSPIKSLEASVSGLVMNAGSIAADVPVFRLGCAVSAFGEAGDVLVQVASDGATNLKAQAKFAAAFTGGFSS